MVMESESEVEVELDDDDEDDIEVVTPDQEAAYSQAQANALTSGESAIEAQRKSLQTDYDDAYNAGDTSKMFTVQDTLSRLNNQQSDFQKQRQEQERWEDAVKQ